MHYHLILTDQCNSECRYCYQKSLQDTEGPSLRPFTYDFSAPPTSTVTVERLREFLEKDEDPVLIFYGGEPLLEIEKIKEVIDGVDVPFRMQTNGLLLDELPFYYVNKIQKILVSLDGTRERTDFNRGKGTYDTVMKNLSQIKPHYTGELIARMTIAQDFPDIYEQVLSLRGDGFTSVHWQLDAGFYTYDFDEKRVSSFCREYNNQISKLVDYWVKGLEKGHVVKLYPFIGIVSSLLEKEKTALRCGAGHAGYAITTAGTLVACPIMGHITDFAAGTLDTPPRDLKTFDVSGRCLRCSIRDVCGGRCLYWNTAGLWPEEGDNLICETIHHLINTLKEKIFEIEELIEKNVIKKEDFEYEKYFGPEIIP
jgi:uncharacterized protein